MSKDRLADLLKLMHLNDLIISAAMYSDAKPKSEPSYLKQGHTAQEEKEWITNMVEYKFKINSTVWFSNGSWATWEEIEYSTGWKYIAPPSLPKECHPVH